MATVLIPADVDERIALYSACVEPLGVTVQHVTNSNDAATSIALVAAGLNVTNAIVSSELTTAAPDLVAAVQTANVVCAIPTTVDEARDRPLGVSLATLTVAETGSVMLSERTLEDRAVGLLTITHITIARTSELVPSLTEASMALREVALRPSGGYASLVTGPSRTADIEMSLTVGVQGPARVFVIFVDTLS